MNSEQLAKFAGRPANANMAAFLAGMEAGGELIEWGNPVVQLHLLAQTGHEANGFLYDREIWGPTKAQTRYEDRADLGHSSAVDNEAWTFRGRGPFQLTGRANYRGFTVWVRGTINPMAPNFEDEPDAVLTDPWEGLSVVYFWQTRKLTDLAKANDFENVTRRINGGINGFDDRMRWFGRAGLTLLGRDPASIREFQLQRQLKPDGIVGTNTRKALFDSVSKLPRPIGVVPVSNESKLRDQLARIKAIAEE